MTASGLQPTWATEQIMKATGLDKPLVLELSAATKHVVDELVADDISVICPPLICFRESDPVAEALLGRLRDPEWEVPPGLLEESAETLASLLDVPVQVVERYSLAGDGTLLVALIDHAGYSDDDPEVEDLGQFLYAWLDTFDPPGRGRKRRRYVTSPLPSADHVLQWLSANHELLRSRGVGIGRPLPSEVDDALVFETQVIDGVRDGVTELLVVAGVVDDSMLESLMARRRQIVEMLGQDSGPHECIIIADGLTVSAQQQHSTMGFGYVSLCELGYRSHLFDAGRLDLSDDAVPDPVRATSMVTSS